MTAAHPAQASRKTIHAVLLRYPDGAAIETTEPLTILQIDARLVGNSNTLPHEDVRRFLASIRRLDHPQARLLYTLISGTTYSGCNHRFLARTILKLYVRQTDPARLGPEPPDAGAAEPFVLQVTTTDCFGKPITKAIGSKTVKMETLQVADLTRPERVGHLAALETLAALPPSLRTVVETRLGLDKGVSSPADPAPPNLSL